MNLKLKLMNILQQHRKPLINRHSEPFELNCSVRLDSADVSRAYGISLNVNDVHNNIHLSAI